MPRDKPERFKVQPRFPCRFVGSNEVEGYPWVLDYGPPFPKINRKFPKYYPLCRFRSQVEAFRAAQCTMRRFPSIGRFRVGDDFDYDIPCEWISGVED